ncbi:proteasome subunit alpha [Longispora urticae]
MAMQFYASPEQIMRDRSEYARKGISRGRSVVVLTYEGGVLFVAENPSTALHKISEIYDRIGFAAVGRYNEFENLRAAGVRMADLRGYSYDRRDVNARGLANGYAQTLGAIFTDSSKPYEVEVCVAQVGATPQTDELYRLTYDGSVGDEAGFIAMGGSTEAISNKLRQSHNPEAALGDALKLAIAALASVGGEGGKPRVLEGPQLEVAVLDRRRPGRKFRRITGAALGHLLDGTGGPSEAESAPEKQPTPTDTAMTAGPATSIDPPASVEAETPAPRKRAKPAAATPPEDSGTATESTDS